MPEILVGDAEQSAYPALRTTAGELLHTAYRSMRTVTANPGSMCPKCGRGDTKLQYCPPEYVVEGLDKKHFEGCVAAGTNHLDGEYLKVKCLTCKYVWVDPVLDN